ncbi:MAG TPA: SemiSWEET transporter [Candidatus Baltobacteraceae bacterium]|nr:SemiSWEET transporter [Candidatus Baltobacteraceae bacterium]
MLTITQAIGFLAGFLATAAFVPQVVRAWKTQSTRDLSLQTIIAFTSGIALWIVYGFLIHSFPLIIWNIITLILNLGILVAKLRHG